MKSMYYMWDRLEICKAFLLNNMEERHEFRFCVEGWNHFENKVNLKSFECEVMNWI
jgi:hypothetical protein